MQESREELDARLEREQAEREVLKQQLHQAPTLYEWTIQKDKPEETWMAVGLVFAGFLVGGLCYWGTNDQFLLWTFIGIGTTLGAMAKFWGGADDYYHYQLTPLGIHYTQVQLVPEYVFVFVRGIAGVGAVVCMIAAVELGPLAFAGAGAFALMAFGFMNYQKPDPDELFIYFKGDYTIFNVKNYGILALESNSEILDHSGDIFSSMEIKQDLINQITPLIDNCKVVEIERYDDMYELHEKFS